MNKNTTISILVIIIVIVLGVIVWKYNSKPEMTNEDPKKILEQQTSADTTSDIDASLNSIDTEGDIDAELKTMDADLESL